MDERDSGLSEEIEILESIYIHELDVQRDENNEVQQLVLQLHPSTGDDVEQRFVCMTLVLDLPPQYPDEPPDFVIKNPRGIAEEEVQSLQEDMHALCEERLGGPVLYELIELAKDSLTAGNLPHCACMICLEHFHDGEQVCKTDCYHYFHGTCLARYVKHTLEDQEKQHGESSQALHIRHVSSKLLCPVCREEINPDVGELPETPVEGAFHFQPSPELREQQRKMAEKLEEQKARGGIIDVEAEKNKYLVTNDVVILNPPPALPDRETNKSPRPGERRDRNDERKARSPRSGYSQRKGQGGKFDDSSKATNNSRRSNLVKDGRDFTSGGRAKTANSHHKQTKHASEKNHKVSEHEGSDEKESIGNENCHSDHGLKDLREEASKERFRNDSRFKDKNQSRLEENEIFDGKTGDLEKDGNVDRKFTQGKGFGKPPKKDIVEEMSDLHLQDSSANSSEFPEDKLSDSAEVRRDVNDEKSNSYEGKDTCKYKPKSQYNSSQSDNRNKDAGGSATRFDRNTKTAHWREENDSRDKSHRNGNSRTFSNKSNNRKGFGRPPHANKDKETNQRGTRSGYDDGTGVSEFCDSNRDTSGVRESSSGKEMSSSHTVDLQVTKETKSLNNHRHDSETKHCITEVKDHNAFSDDRDNKAVDRGCKRPNRKGFGRPPSDQKHAKECSEPQLQDLSHEDHQASGIYDGREIDSDNYIDNRGKHTNRYKARSERNHWRQSNNRAEHGKNSAFELNEYDKPNREHQEDDGYFGKSWSDGADIDRGVQKANRKGFGRPHERGDRRDERQHSYRDKEANILREGSGRSNRRRGFGRPPQQTREQEFRGGKVTESSVGDKRADASMLQMEKESMRISSTEKKHLNENDLYLDCKKKISDGLDNFSKSNDNFNDISESFVQKSSRTDHGRKFRKNSHDDQHARKPKGQDLDDMPERNSKQKMSSQSSYSSERRDNFHSAPHPKRKDRTTDSGELMRKGDRPDKVSHRGGNGGKQVKPPPGFSASVPPGFQGKQPNEKIILPPPGL